MTRKNMVYTKEQVDKFFEIIKEGQDVKIELEKATNNQDIKATEFNEFFNLLLNGQIPPDFIFEDSKFLDDVSCLKLFTEKEDLLILDDGHA